MTTLDEVFGLLDQKRRRFVLYYLDEADGPVPLEELAVQVAEWEDDSAGDVPAGAFDDVSLTLQHHHLPRAARAEFIEYDRENGIVRLTGTPPEFSVVLKVARAIQQPSEVDGVGRLLDLV